MTSETLITRGSDWIEWLDATGFTNAKQTTSTVSPTSLNITLTNAPKDLKLEHKFAQSVLWRTRPVELKQVHTKTLTENDLQRPTETPYTVEGLLQDPTDRYLPRIFFLQAGNRNGHQIALYRSPMNCQFRSAGGILGTLHFANGTIASWAIILVTVTPHLGSPLDFTAQADIHGEFRLPMDRLPALHKDTPAQTYTAIMKIKATPPSLNLLPTNPDTLPLVKIANGKNNTPVDQFGDTLNFAIKPGEIMKIASPEHPFIVIQSI